MALENLFKSFPPPLQNGIKRVQGFIPVRLRYPRSFWKMYDFLEKSQWWDKGRLEEYQLSRLQQLLAHAYRDVPYYTRVFDERGLKPDDISSLSDLKMLPYLTKDIMRNNSPYLISRDVNRKKLVMGKTSGTTGTPLQYFETYTVRWQTMACIYHLWSRLGIKPGTPMLQLRGGIIPGNKPTEYDPFLNVLRFSAQVNGRAMAEKYLVLMSRFGAKYLHGYPSIISSFAFLIKKHGLKMPLNLKAVIFASECVYPWMIDICKEVFNCRVFRFYGMGEKVTFAGECEDSFNYHCVPQVAITEFDRETNEIIGTGLLNFAQPFIRYKTTDVASLPVENGCSKCTRNYFPVFRDIEGRFGDYLVTSSGRLFAPVVVTHPFKGLKNIRHTQIIQKDKQSILLRVVLWEDAEKAGTERDLNYLKKHLHEMLGEEIRIELEIVDSIPLSASGKFQWVISDIAKDFMMKGIR